VKIDWRWKNQQQYLRWSLCNWLFNLRRIQFMGPNKAFPVRIKISMFQLNDFWLWSSHDKKI